MSTVQLNDQEWQQVMAVLAQAPWNVANPLLMKIGEQLRRQTIGNSGENPIDQGRSEHIKSTN